MYTCAGANSVPVCVSPQDREASKSNAVCWPFIAPCCGFIPSDAPSPLRTPEDSQTYEHISRSILPVSARPVSVCQLPTFSDVNPVQARKSAGRGKNPFLFAMLFEKNIEIFSDPNPSVLCVFSICLPPFRGWTSGAGREAGSAQGDAARNISANAPYLSTNQIGAQAEGAFSWHTLIGPLTLITYETEASGGLSFESSRVVPTAEENRPVNVALPVCIYLGLPA